MTPGTTRDVVDKSGGSAWTVEAANQRQAYSALSASAAGHRFH